MMPVSLFYIASYLALCAAIFIFPKTRTRQRQNAFLWLVASMLLSECWASVSAGLFSLLHIPVTLVSVGAAHLAAAAFLYFRTAKAADAPDETSSAPSKPDKAILRSALCKEKSHIHASDIAMGILLLALILFFGYTRFYTANPIIFATIDPAERLGNAMNIAVSKTVITHFPNQYFIQLSGSLFIQALQGLIPGISPFRFFEWKDLCNLWFTGALFYGAAQLFMRSRFSKTVSFLLTLVFLLGYPWTGQLFGFVYPGVALNLTLLILIAFTLLYKGALDRIPAYLLISLACFGLGVCYTLYAPPVFLAAFLAIFVYERNVCSTRLVRTLRTELFIFTIPALWTLVNSVLLDLGGEINVGNSITDEGAIYRNLFTDFLPYAPIALWFLWRTASRKKWDFASLFALVFAVYQLAIFVLMLQSRVSTYYYYKLYFQTWFIVLFLACLGIDALVRHARVKRLVAAYMVCWALVAALGISGADYLIESHKSLSNPQPGADVSFRVYATNLLYFRPPGEYNVINYDWAFIELCEEARRLSGSVDEVHHIEIVTDSISDTFWKDALTSQLLIPRTNDGHPENTQGLWIVLKENPAYEADRGYYDSFERLFENSRGFIVKPGE